MFEGRCEDMRPLGKGVLSVYQDKQGDIHVQIIADDREKDEDFHKFKRVSIEFTNSCSRSPETIKALEKPQEAIKKDNENSPEFAWPQQLNN